MKYALITVERKEAQPGLSGDCPHCNRPMVAKCGKIKIWHWAHRGKRTCDTWWENETEWHRTWKGQFPDEWQEVRHKAENGEWHIADVKTKQGHILEFQHSFLKPEERVARNSFYGNNLVWLVDGLKRKKDQLQLDSLLKNAILVHQSISLYRLPSFFDECLLIKEWSECTGPVFFDFGSELPLWCLLPKSPKAALYIGPFPRQIFVGLHNGALNKDGKSFSELMKILTEIITTYENLQQQVVGMPIPTAPNRFVMQRQIPVPRNPSQRYLYHLNRSPRRHGRL